MAQLRLVVGDEYTDGGAAVHRLDHGGQSGLFHQLLQIRVQQVHPAPLGGDHLVGHQPLGQILVHGDGGGQIAGAGVGHAQQIQGGLDAAVLAAGPVQAQIHRIRLLAQLQHPGPDGGGILPLSAGPDLLQVGCLTAHRFERVGDGRMEQLLRPAGIVLQPEEQIHQGHLMAPFPQGLAHLGARGQGHIAFRAESARQYYYLHIQHLISG